MSKKMKYHNSEKMQIVINVDESSDARIFSTENSIIQKDALNDLIENVRDTTSKIENFVNSLDKENVWSRIRHHDVITILGGRGTGKTTFVLNALNLMSSQDRNLKLTNIGVIDPTLVECRESIFLNIISRIRQIVDRWYDSIHSSSSNRCGEYENFQNKLNSLAKGLAQLTGIGSKALAHDVWDDPEYIMQEGLHNVQQGEALERDFHLFIDAALKCINQNAFIMAFDDIDTNFSKGWDVLEILRKYLTSPQLIVMLSGDFDLYSNLVRMQQWKYFDKDFIKMEIDTGLSDNSKRFQARVDSLEDQYMLKLLKPSRRIELKRLEQVVSEYSVYVDFGRTNNAGPVELNKLLQDMLVTHYHLTSSTGLTEARSHLIKLPVRTVMQILRAIDSVDFNSKFCENSSKIFTMHDQMARIFATSLVHMGFQWPKDILAARERYGMNILTMRLFRNNLLVEGSALPPTLGSDDRTSAALIMSGHYAVAISQNPSLLFDYYIKVLLTRDEVGASSIDAQSSYLKEVSLEVDDLSIFTAQKHGAYTQKIAFNQNARPISRGYLRVSANWVSNEGTSGVLKRICGLWGVTDLTIDQLASGNIPLNINEHVRDFLSSEKQSGIKLKNIQRIGRYFNTTDSLSKNISSWHKSIVNLLIVGVSDGGKKSAYFVSAYRLLGLLGLLADLDTEALSNIIKRNLWPRAVIRSEHIDRKDEDDLENGEISGDGELNTDFSSLETFLNIVEEWREKKDDIITLPLQVYADAWDRFQSTIEKIAEELKDLHAGFVVEKFSIAFLNALLVEECLYRNENIKLNLDRPITAENNFTENLSAIEFNNSGSKVCPFFSWVFACPLWSILLDPERNSISYHVNLLAEAFSVQLDNIDSLNFMKVQYHDVFFDNLFPLMNSLLVPYDHKPSKSSVAFNTQDFNYVKELAVSSKNAREYISFLKPLSELSKSIRSVYYDECKELLSSNWVEVERILANFNADRMDNFVNIAMHNVFSDIVAKSISSINQSYVKETSQKGQAYLRAFLENYIENEL